MTYKIELSLLSKLDLEDIYAYIKNTLCASKAANDVFNKIKSALYSAAYFPYRFRKLGGFDNQNLRVITIGNYNIIFSINNERGIVFIVRILYSGRDIANIVEKSILH